MKIGDKLLKELNKTYPPDTLVNLRFGRYDVVLKTDASGLPILLFVGEADEQGQIRGERFVHRLVRDANGKIVKDHWDNQGKV